MKDTRDNSYVVGAPRAGNKRTGEVLIIKGFETDWNQVNLLQTISGHQLGEYFGAAVTTVDLDNDGLDELIVGSPLTTNEKLRVKRSSGKYIKVGDVTMFLCTTNIRHPVFHAA